MQATQQQANPYPLGELAEESTDKFHGTRARVHPTMQGDTAWTGEVGMVLKHGRLFEVAREGKTLRIRVEGSRIELLPPAPPAFQQITWRGEIYNEPSIEALQEWVSDSVCETPDGETVEPDHPDSWLSILGLI